MKINKKDSRILAKLYSKELGEEERVSIVYSKRAKVYLVVIEREDNTIEYIDYFLKEYSKEEVGELVERREVD